MQITDNIPFVIGTIFAKFDQLSNPETVARAAALAVMPELRHRIHVEGKKSDGSKIGTYSNNYLKLRQRAPYNRTANSEVIASLTRQLENGYVLTATEKGYTIGNASPYNDEKIKHLEEKYGTIWQLTEREREIALLTANEEAKLLFAK